MMAPPIAALVAQSAAIKAQLGSSPVRFWEFGEAERGADGKVQAPYAVWQTIYGSPENFVAGKRRDDLWGIQLDVYAKTPAQARQIAELLRDLVELQGNVVGYNGESIDDPTGLRRYSFTAEWITER